MNVQMNVRIEESLKAAGDDVFASVGLTPTQVVRNVWEYAVRHREAPAIVRAALQSSPAQLASLERKQAADEIDEAASLVARFREQWNLPAPDVLVEPDYRALREQAYYDKAAERGLL